MATDSDFFTIPSFEAADFSNDQPTTSYKPSRIRWSSNSKATTTGSKGHFPPYHDYVNNPEPLNEPIKRQRTGNTVFSVASSAWSSTKEFAVSHFNVPKLAAPWEHEISEKEQVADPPLHSTVRQFDYRRQRRRLFVNSFFQLLITMSLCAIMAGALYGFSAIGKGLSQSQKRGFNALITGLSIILGLNLASSLTGYAQMMRWRLLKSGYRTIQDFELLLNCDRQSKVFRILWGGRTRGQRYPNRLQLLALVWLLINMAVQVFVALLGLTYSIDMSTSIVHLSPGAVSVANLTTIYTSKNATTFNGEAAAANQFGIAGQTFHDITLPFKSLVGVQDAYFWDPHLALYWYRFVDHAAANYVENVISARVVSSKATCTSFPVVHGGYAGFDNPARGDQWVNYTDAAGTNQSFWVPASATGATTWLATTNSTNTTQCGPRCARLWALQSANNISSSVPVPRFWQCNNTVSHLSHVDLYGNSRVFDIADEQARILAGAIGWSGHTIVDSPFDDSLQWVLYTTNSTWSPPSSVSEADMARIVMKYTAGAISAIDNVGHRVNVSDAYMPSPAQVVNVQWQWAGFVLGVIPFAQALVLLCVIAWADDAIIKDTSHLSTARLLRPLVEKLGDRGSLLTGDEIAEELGNFKVIYGPRPRLVRAEDDNDKGNEDRDKSVMRLDVIEESEAIATLKGRMPAGRYD